VSVILVNESENDSIYHNFVVITMDWSVTEPVTVVCDLDLLLVSAKLLMTKHQYVLLSCRMQMYFYHLHRPVH